jgi:hypothetical protein
MWPFTSVKRSPIVAYVVKLVNSDTDESEILGVFSYTEGAWDFAQKIAKQYNRFEWYISIEEFTIDSVNKVPTLPNDDLDAAYPCPIEWEN